MKRRSVAETVRCPRSNNAFIQLADQIEQVEAIYIQRWDILLSALTVNIITPRWKEAIGSYARL